MADVEANVAVAQPGAKDGKKKSSCCAKCCKCYCVCCCCCLLLVVIAVIVVFNTVLKVEAKNPPAPAAPTSAVELGVSYAGADPNSDETFKSNLVSGVLGSLGGNLTDADGSLASSLVFSSSGTRRLKDTGAADRQLAAAWTVTLTLSGEAAMSAADVFTGPGFSPSSIAGVVSLSVSSEMSVLAMGHLLKDMNFVCTTAISKVLDEYSGEITSGMEKKNVSGVQLGISEEGWVWVAFRKAGWKYSPTAMACEATELWEKAIKGAMEQDLGECKLSDDGVKALVGSGRGGDECYINDYRSLLTEGQLAQCPGTSLCENQGSQEVCADFEYPGCSLCEAPATVSYLPCTPF